MVKILCAGFQYKKSDYPHRKSVVYSLAIYLYMLCANIVSLFNKKARLMMRGHHQAWKILRQKIGACAANTPKPKSSSLSSRPRAMR